MEQNSFGRVLVTSGPTRAYLDRIRYIANTSSGTLGARIVESLIARDIPVVHMYGQGSETPAVSDTGFLKSMQVITVDDLIKAVEKVAADGEISAVVHAMAVLDYVPELSLDTKKKSGGKYWDIRLAETPKVIAIIRNLMPDACCVGFKLEAGVTEDQLREKAGVLLQSNNLDLVVANDIDRVSETGHEAICVGKGNRILKRLHTKTEIAEYIAELIVGRMT